MIVQCENCETRFHVADARIPEKGARVRCSRCHHRFHITPSSGTSAGPSAGGDVSARSEPRGGGEPREDDELDNPEFLFDDESKTGQRPPPARPAGRPAERAAAPAPAPAAAAPPEPDPEPEPEASTPLEERVVATTGKTAQEMLDEGAPNLGPGSVEFASSLRDQRARHKLAADFSESEEESPASARATPSPIRPAKPPKAAAPPSPELDAGFGDSLSDAEADPGWQSLTSSEEPANVFEAGASFGLVAAPSAPVAEASGSATLFAETDLPPTDTRKRHAPGVVAFDPEAASPLALIVRAAALLVGVALLGGALRGLELQREASLSGPSLEQAAGWTAADVETFAARDSSGERVLVVRGNLVPDGAAPPPEVEVGLLDASGARVGEPRRALLERLDDAEIAPEGLALRLAAAPGELAGRGPKVTGFTALLADPPAGARRVQVTLNPGRAPAQGTTAATTPARPQAPATGLAQPETRPSAPARKTGKTPRGTVLPAAPEPID